MSDSSGIEFSETPREGKEPLPGRPNNANPSINRQGAASMQGESPPSSPPTLLSPEDAAALNRVSEVLTDKGIKSVQGDSTSG